MKNFPDFDPQAPNTFYLPSLQDFESGAGRPLNPPIQYIPVDSLLRQRRVLVTFRSCLRQLAQVQIEVNAINNLFGRS
ncbi:MAG: hypothetical protein SFT81_03815 [Candidatus Caenarcaniphilales bacterium]|nr:hypothetical protein [Candidatus Caenarcaniphilales bacterium]